MKPSYTSTIFSEALFFLYRLAAEKGCFLLLSGNDYLVINRLPSRPHSLLNILYSAAGNFSFSTNLILSSLNLQFFAICFTPMAVGTHATRTSLFVLLDMNSLRESR